MTSVLCEQMPLHFDPPRSWDAGYVYLAVGHPDRYTKIGRTIRLDQRFAGTKQYGFRVFFVWAAYVPAMCPVERFLHHQFEHVQKGKRREEWFDLREDDTAIIKRTLMQWADHIVYPLRGKTHYIRRDAIPIKP